MTPEDARTVLEEMRDGAQTAGQWVRDTDPPGLQQLRAHHVRRRDALDVALSALALVEKVSQRKPSATVQAFGTFRERLYMLARNEFAAYSIAGDACVAGANAIGVLDGLITEARALVPQEPTA